MPVRIVTPNAEQIVLAQKEERFHQVLNEADVCLPDGIGVVWGMRRRLKIKDKRSPSTRISGIDFMIDLCRMAERKNSRVFLYGGRGGAAKEALTTLQKQFPTLQGFAEDGAELSEGMRNYELGIANNEKIVIDHLVQIIRGKNIKVVFIGLGAPKQEYLIDGLNKRLAGVRVILMAVGGSFDVLAGKIPRAPKYVQTIGFEWLWRLIQEPWRWQRQIALLHFIQLVLLSKIRDN